MLKKQSMLETANYKELIDDLYETQISGDPNENKQLQKTVANTVIGLLEKTINKNTKSKIFTDLSTARYYQVKYGGDITEIKQFEQFKTQSVSPLDYLVNDVPVSTMLEHQPTGKSLHILTQSVSADLHNGFIYIKELLLQHHAFYMYRSIETLKTKTVSKYIQ
jgi:hypothetical protein